jgi:hypothetical protein
MDKYNMKLIHDMNEAKDICRPQNFKEFGH